MSSDRDDDPRGGCMPRRYGAFFQRPALVQKVGAKVGYLPGPGLLGPAPQVEERHPPEAAAKLEVLEDNLGITPLRISFARTMLGPSEFSCGDTAGTRQLQRAIGVSPGVRMYAWNAHTRAVGMAGRPGASAAPASHRGSPTPGHSAMTTQQQLPGWHQPPAPIGGNARLFGA